MTVAPAFLSGAAPVAKRRIAQIPDEPRLTSRACSSSAQKPGGTRCRSEIMNESAVPGTWRFVYKGRTGQ